MDSTSFCLGNNFEYSMFPSKPSCDLEPVTLPPISDFENQTHDLLIQPVLYLVSIDLCYYTKQVIPLPSNYFEN
jgi:hypothetical protein